MSGCTVGARTTLVKCGQEIWPRLRSRMALSCSARFEIQMAGRYDRIVLLSPFAKTSLVATTEKESLGDLA